MTSSRPPLVEILPGILFALALALYAPRLATPPRYVFDEVYHAYTAGEYVRGNPDAYVWYTKSPQPNVAYMWNHPPAGVWMIAAGIRIWGDEPYGWRFMSAVFGAAGVAIIFALTRTLSGSLLAGAFAALLLLLDGLYFVQSRTAMLDVYGVVFMLGAFAALYAFWTAPPERAVRPLFALGLFLGLAIATKWNAAYASLLSGLAVLGRLTWQARSAARTGDRALRDVVLRNWLAVPMALGVVPIAVYMLAYVPFFLVGHTWPQFVELQKQIFYYHAHLKATHSYQSTWWHWPMVMRPVWYYVERTETTVANLYAQANPLLYWSLVPGVLWQGVRWLRARHPALVVLLIGFFGQWLPWALVPRIAFLYHFLPAASVGCLALGVLVADGWRRGGVARAAAIAYLILVASAFVYFYPIYATIPISQQAFSARLWLPTWR